MEYQVQTRSQRTRKFVQSMMPSIVDQLGLARSRKFVLIDITRHAGQGNDGSVTELPGCDAYVIAIKPGSLHHIGVTLAHEMVHVKQMAQGTLRTHNGQKFWCGRRTSKRLGYLDQPWEQEAFAKQELIFRRALEA